MTETFTMRDAREDDLPRVLQLYEQLAADAPDDGPPPAVGPRHIDAFRAIDADPCQRLLVLEAGGRVLATAVLLIAPNLSHGGRPFALAENVVVDAAERARGYGEQLMRFIMDEARATGCYKLVLTSALRREDAHRFYERLGFDWRSKGFRIDFE